MECAFKAEKNYTCPFYRYYLLMLRKTEPRTVKRYKRLT